MSTTWKAAPHPNNCNFSVHGSHEKTSNASKQVFCLLKSPRSQLFICIFSHGKPDKDLLEQEGRETVGPSVRRYMG
jgi:hypothetical protein